MAQFANDWIPLYQADTTTSSSVKTFTVPAGHQWRIKSIYCAYTTNATVGNRNVQVEVLTPGSVVIYSACAGTTQAASLTRNYNFAPYLADLTAFRNTTFLSTPLAGLILQPGYILKVYDVAAIAPAGASENLLVHLQYDRYGGY